MSTWSALPLPGYLPPALFIRERLSSVLLGLYYLGFSVTLTKLILTDSPGKDSLWRLTKDKTNRARLKEMTITNGMGRVTTVMKGLQEASSAF